MVERWVTLAEAGGLHARAAARLVQRQHALRARVTVEYAGRQADAGSLTSLLALGAGVGARVRLVAEGEGAAEALEWIQEALEPSPVARTYAGVGVSPGTGVGRALLSSDDAWAAPTIREASAPSGEGSDPGEQWRRLEQALRQAEMQLAGLEVWAQREAGGASDILRAERAMLGDAVWLALLETRVRQGFTAEAAVRLAGEAPLARPEEGGPGNGLREVLHDVSRRVLRSLAHEEPVNAKAAEQGGRLEPIVLVTRQATPSELLEWPRERLAGVVATVGGAHAHAALIARALGVPMVVGIGETLVALLRPAALDASGEPRPLVRVDGTHGVVTLEPGEAVAVATPREPRVSPAFGASGVDRPALLANADTPEDVRRALGAGAQGIGLARTERLFLGRELPPDEEEQYRSLQALADACAGRPLTLRLADLGGGKAPPYLLALLGADALGRRGAGLLAWSPALARPHLRALARVARGADAANYDDGPRVTLMVPMVATREEWLGVLARWREASEAIGAQAPLCLLVETPSAAMEVGDYLDDARAIALGTNDLAVLLFGGDRERGEGVRQPLTQPLMLRLVHEVITRAHERGRPVTACGDMAGRFPEALILWGLGVDALSVTPERLGPVGRALQVHDAETVRARSRELLDLKGAARVRERLNAWRRAEARELTQDQDQDWLGSWE